MRFWSRRAAAVAATLVLAAPAWAQQAAPAPESGAFVVTIGRDTLAVEKFTRTADRLKGEIVSRSPRTVHRTYDATLNPDGSVARIELTSRPLSGGPVTNGTIVFTADSATWTVRRNDSTTTRTLAVRRPAAPVVTNSHALIEQAVLQARAAGLSTAEFSLVQLGAASASSMTMRGADGADNALDLL
ncbi:MAG TPA: hypothetical protein VFQ39_13365, partial [Longimicrobium sp.]|nr:hypothetical protein [Longimicrobium sp.]